MFGKATFFLRREFSLEGRCPSGELCFEFLFLGHKLPLFCGGAGKDYLFLESDGLFPNRELVH